MKIISVANQKGGCGKTITAVNVSAAFACLGKKVLFIDLDPQAHASMSFGIVPQEPQHSSYSIFESFLNKNSFDIYGVASQKSQKLWIIGSHISLSTMEQRMAGIQGAVTALSSVLKSQETLDFDYVIIDTPPNLGFLTFNAIHASSSVLVPVDVSVFSLNGVSQIEGLIELSKSMGFETPLTHYLITLFDRRSNFAKSFIDKAKERLGSRLMKTIIRSNIKLREAASMAKTIFEYDPLSNGAVDYFTLVKEMSPELKTEPINTKYLSAEKFFQKQLMFKIQAPDAQNIYVAGDFNNWSVNESSAMTRLQNGWWVKNMRIPAGKYRYKFVVDGNWIEDPLNNLNEVNEYGGRNSLIAVG